MIDWPKDLVEDIAARRSVLFLGAGVSKNAVNDDGEHPKDWKEFLRHLADSVPDATKKAETVKCLEDGDLLTACELARRFLRQDVFKSALLHEYSSKGFKATEIHDHLVAIDSRFVLTTNFDRLYETYANHVQANTVRVKNYYDPDVADVFRRSDRVVLKIHGTIDTPDKTIFTRKDYAEARTHYYAFYRLLDALFVTHTYVFLGASMNDPDMRILLEDHAYRFPGTRPHYMVSPMGSISDSVLSIMEESMNIRAILYDPVDSHKQLSTSVGELASLVEQGRNELTRTTNW